MAERIQDTQPRKIRPQRSGAAPVTLHAPAAAGSAGDADDPPFPFQRRWLAALLAAYLLSRLALLLLTQRYLMSDEAVVGVMAQDILTGKPIPFFLYGQHYGGGHVVEALLMAPGLWLFGPSDFVVKAVPVVLGLLFLLVVYWTLHRFFSRRLALLALGVNAFCCLFVAGNFLVSGQMATQLITWLGLYFFFRHHYSGRPRLLDLGLAGLALGFGIYCYDYPVIYLAAILGLMVHRHRLGLRRRWREPAMLCGGALVGALPLIVYLLRNQFKHFQWSAAAEAPGPPLPLRVLQNIGFLLVRDFPGSFQKDLYDYPAQIAWSSWLPWLVFCAALGYLVITFRRPLVQGMRGLAGPPPPPAPREQRILCLVLFFAIYAAAFCVSRHSGGSPRYILPFFPVMPILFAWAVERLARSRPAWAILGAALFLAPQLWQVTLMARGKAPVEWGIPLGGKDLKQVVKFLEERNLTTVVTPYELKWKLMFHSEGRITGASLVFGYDRDTEINARVLGRIEKGEAPLVMVLDKGLLLPRVQQLYNPERVFDMEAFHAFLKRNDVRYTVTPIGDFVVYHGFSKHFRLFPSFYNMPLQP